MSEKKFRGGDLVAEVFKKEGVKYIFGIAGGHIYPMIEGCEERGIKYIGVRHEMTAAFMAEGWALTTGEVGVCAGTAGPGFTNLITGLANSYCGGIPVLCMAGKAKISEYDRNALQDFNQIDMVKEMTKHARSVLEPHRIPEYVGRAIAYATTGSPGPVYLEIPRDLMEGEVDASKVEFQKIYRMDTAPMGDSEQVKAAAELIKQAERPVIIAGGGVWWSRGGKELAEFAEKSGIPVFTRNAARGIMPDDHELHMGIAVPMHPLFNAALSEADLAIVIGTRTGFTLNRSAFPGSQKIVRVDINPAELTNQLDIEVGIVGDARNVLKQLTDAVEPKNFSEWVDFIKMMKSNMMSLFAPMAESEDVPINPMRLVSEVARRVDKDTIVIVDGGDSASWGNMVIPPTGPGQYLSIAATSFGPLGVGIPYAMAAKLAHPDKKVILLTGDGTFGYGAMEYDTAMRYNIPFTTVILNDKCWGMIKRSEAKKRTSDKDFYGLDLAEVHYEKIVEVFGGYGEYVTQPEDIGPALDRAIASGKPACVNVMTDVNIGPPTA